MVKVTVTPEQARALEDGDVTVALEMKQPPKGYTLHKVDHDDASFVQRGFPYSGVKSCSRHLPAPKGSTVEVKCAEERPVSAPILCVGFKLPYIHVCTAIVKDVRVVEQDGKYVALTRIERKEQGDE